MVKVVLIVVVLIFLIGFRRTVSSRPRRVYPNGPLLVLIVLMAAALLLVAWVALRR
jgi:hypothetical protein